MSRETRLLLGIVFISIAMLWLLARLRFPERGTAPSPVPPLLTQLMPRSTFEDLALSLTRIAPRFAGSVVALEFPETGGIRDGSRRRFVPGLKIRDDAAVTLVPSELGENGGPRCPTSGQFGIVECDPASAFAVVHVSPAPATLPEIWSPRAMQQPRYMIAATVSREGSSLRPVFIGSLHAVASPVWFGAIWALPPSTGLVPGTFVFTTEGSWVGLVVDHGNGTAIAPGELVIKMAERLSSEEDGSPGTLGIVVQPLTPAIAAATGAPNGVIVASVDRAGPASGQLAVMDVIEAIDGNAVATGEHWRARVARLRASESLRLRVRRRGETLDVTVAASPLVTGADDRLGATMRTVRGVGSEVVHLQEGSAAARAGIEVGDVVTAFDELHAPTPSQISRLFAGMSSGRSVLVATTRGSAHHVLVLEK